MIVILCMHGAYRHCERLTWFDVGGQVHVVCFVPGEGVCDCRLAGHVLERHDAHTDQVRSMNTLERLGQHTAYALRIVIQW
jgi:hypothetical protein